jgi:hypothetical protein
MFASLNGLYEIKSCLQKEFPFENKEQEEYAQTVWRGECDYEG